VVAEVGGILGVGVGVAGLRRATPHRSRGLGRRRRRGVRQVVAPNPGAPQL